MEVSSEQNQSRTDSFQNELRTHALDSLFADMRTLSMWFAPILLVFSVLDYWLLPTPSRSAEVDFRLIVVGIDLLFAAGCLALAIWLRYRPPAPKWANPIALSVGIAALVRSIAICLANPEPVRVLGLVIVIIGAGCVLQSRRRYLLFVTAAAWIWHSTAFWRDSSQHWGSTWFITIVAALLAFLVLLARRRTLVELVASRALDRHLSDDLTTRVRLGETLVKVSARFVGLRREDFDHAVEATFRELGSALGADHAFACRIDRDSMRNTLFCEWTASAVDSRRAQVHRISLTGHDWFFKRLSTGEVTNISSEGEAGISPDEAALLQLLDVESFLAVPIARSDQLPWGFLGVAQWTRPTHWSDEEANTLHVVSDILLSTMERHHAETRVRLSEARFRSLFDANIIGVFFGSLYGKISDANGAFFEITGYQATDLPLRLDEMTPTEWRSADEASVLRLLKTGVDLPWEKELIRKDGVRIPILIGGALLSQRRGEWVAFVLDLTRRRDDERKIQELNAALDRAARIGTMGEMTAGLAHEVHQPIAAIANYANGARARLARKRLSDENLTEVFTEIAAQCERAGSVIRNVRDFVRGLHPERRPVDLNVAVAESVQLTRFDVHNRQVTVTTELADNLPPVLTDPTQLSQVLLNLILNAVQAMDPELAERRLIIRTRLTIDGFVEAIVRDTGRGVLPEDRDRLFDQFFTTKPDGMGLGLSIARSIAERYGGTLKLTHSGPDGTEFTLQLPPAENARFERRPMVATKFASGNSAIQS